MREHVYYPIYGTFKVTTEGDVEGRTVTDLGTYTGYIDDIALKLADRAYYGLRFKLQKPDSLDKVGIRKSSVSISLDIDSGTWDLDTKGRTEYFKNLFHGRPVTIEDGQYYASVNLKSGLTPEDQKRIQEEIERDNARAKLTSRERKLLGID